MLIIGLTGGIGMGKSTVAKILKDFGLPVYSADEAVHDLLTKKGAAVKRVAKIFPEALCGDTIDRRVLGKLVFNNTKKLKVLERLLHPLVHRAEKAFITRAKYAKAPAVILEIPLLFETKADKRCDVVVCVVAPKAVQRARVMRRKGMTEARFKAIIARQMSDVEKRARADYIIPTGTSTAATRTKLRELMADLMASRKD